ncbi:MAG: deoxyribodipyrimidine photolyase [Flavobacterium sp. MedPE-SWcel]|uniref:cryptochrome/photolyase family protein n=1 Tax=uncultured Flavobacterium sp. TaxID=165435 RepID=UPI00091D4F74|nr:deoxyribodipyrimidine photo-lyase [uncultured Flavobacterium sp.]OIQ18649.1 MAG: deoxyribodipyrimidine photolyase [Flavobacterium sp. MedPE-SWcel]
MIVFWYRRDLRLEDNKGLYEALTIGEEVLPIFIFDKSILAELSKNDARVTFIHSLLEKLQSQLKEHGSSLAIFHDTPENVFKKLTKENTITAVYTNHDYEPYAIQRDKTIAKQLQKNNINFHTFKDQVIFEKEEITKDDGNPYVVYTPYMKKWRRCFDEIELTEYNTVDKTNNLTKHSYPFLSLDNIGFEESTIKPIAYTVSTSLIDNYEETRDFPAIQGTSGISPYLRFGAVSIRMLVKKALQSKNIIYLKELIWREFFMQILWHYPNTITKSFRPKYDSIEWRNNNDEFKLWCEGKTGYPMVDAGMRELNQTGYMHNRVRMVVASFLCKHLLIDWRWGEAYFAKHLLDYEQSSNVGNWQWAAGSGVDAAPYFRIFNPTEQVKKFDKELKYIKKWVPELEELNYPSPIVNHKEARERALSVYKKAVS